jgi:hypothetical protein
LKGPVTVQPHGKRYTLDEMGDRVEMLGNFDAKVDYSRDYPKKHTHEALYCNATPCAATNYP